MLYDRQSFCDSLYDVFLFIVDAKVGKKPDMCKLFPQFLWYRLLCVTSVQMTSTQKICNGHALFARDL